ncbi:hypothetical protein P9112_006503 [Eukaryota sp. TZLM1-RC]
MSNSISPAAQRRAMATRMFLDSYFRDLSRRTASRSIREHELQKQLADPSLSSDQKQSLINEFKALETAYLRSSRVKLTITDFESVAVIGRGGFGEVRLVRHINSGKYLALKILSKSNIVKRGYMAHVLNEREIMSSYSPFLVQLHASFTTTGYLYLLMDYCAGGDLMALLIAEDIFPEHQVRLYAAEMVEALSVTHRRGFLHRDLKPDNILIDADGHLKLADFGLSTQGEAPLRPADVYADMLAEYRQESNDGPQPLPSVAEKYKARRRRLRARSTCGTPDFTAPEVLLRRPYSNSVDWWSLGCIIYEMLVGYAPFFAQTQYETCRRIVNWKKTLNFPPGKCSPLAEDLIRKLLCEEHIRLGTKSVTEIRNHPFFKDIEWKKLKLTQAPWVPELESEADTRYFDEFPDHQDFFEEKDDEADMFFKGFSFRSFDSVKNFAQS